MREQPPTAGGVVAVTGATGFVGSRFVRLLRSSGSRVRAVVRSTKDAPPLRALGCDVTLGDVRSRPSLEEGFAGCAAVVHLVAVLREVGTATYDAINRQGTANVVAAAQGQGVGRIVHLSALGAHPQSTRYLRSKWAGEEEVRRGRVPYAIFRPSFIIGPSGGPAAQFAEIVRLGFWYPLRRPGSQRWLAALAGLIPLVPILGSGQAKFMPVHIDDLFQAVRQALHRDDVFARTFEIGGPNVVTYDDMMQEVAHVLSLRRWAVHIPVFAAWVLVRLVSVLPNPPITPDEFDSLLRDNVCDNSSVIQTFDLTLRPFKAALADAVQGGAIR